MGKLFFPRFEVIQPFKARLIETTMFDVGLCYGATDKNFCVLIRRQRLGTWNHETNDWGWFLPTKWH